MAATWSSGSTLHPSSFGNERNDDSSSDTGFTFVDFLPEVRERGGFFTNATYENFRTLVNRANEWLRVNEKWKITTCESVEFKAKGEEVDTNKMTYLEYGESTTSYTRGLRLWLTERKDDRISELEIGYLDLIPQQIENSGMFSSDKFEDLDAVIQRFNSMLHTNPLPGRVITIESQEMKLPSSRAFDPDRSSWSEYGSGRRRFIFVLRIFYYVMTGKNEEIGVQDFVPDLVSRGGICNLPQYEPFSSVVHKASAWCAQQQELRICHVQSVEMKMKRGTDLNTKRMYYTEHGSVATYYIRVLRIAYTKPPTYQYSRTENPSVIRQLTCKTFVPVQLSQSLFMAEFENLLQTKKRVTAWVKATGAIVVSAETSALRMKSGGERKAGTEASFTYNRSEVNEYWIFVIRLYLNGFYREPPPEMLPPLPDMEDQNCCAIL